MTAEPRDDNLLSVTSTREDMTTARDVLNGHLVNRGPCMSLSAYEQTGRYLKDMNLCLAGEPPQHVNPAAVPALLEACRTVSQILTQAVEHSQEMEEGEFLVEVDADWLLRQAGTLRTAIRSTVTEQKGQ